MTKPAKKRPALFVTGHRPEKLGGHDQFKKGMPAWTVLRNTTATKIQQINPSRVFTGMALGFDQLVAYVCRDLKIPFVACVPFEGQEKLWPAEAQREYNELLKLAARKVVVCTGDYAGWKMHARNQYVVQNGDVGLACWDGSNGGTAGTIREARLAGKTVDIIDPREVLKEWL